MNDWVLSFHEYKEQEEKFRETLFTLGNGYFATRGCSEEIHSNKFHYPGTYLAGGYDRLRTELDGMLINSEDLVNWPNWLPLTFRIQDEEWFSLDRVNILSYEESLDMKAGELRKKIHFNDSKDRETRIEYCRFVSMENSHVGGIKFIIEALNWSSSIEVLSMVDGSVINSGVKRYEKLGRKHLDIVSKDWGRGNYFILNTSTHQSRILLSQAIRTDFYIDDHKQSILGKEWDCHEKIGHTFQLEAQSGKKIQIEKLMTLFSSKDHACSHPTYESLRLLKELSTYDDLLSDHKKQWERLWNTCKLELPGKTYESLLLHLDIFHLLQTVSLNSIDLDVGVPARGLHGEAYRGHIFWDEMFIMPFLNFRIPELSRSLLMYRYRRLSEAKLNARMIGLSGAMFPWQSGSNGEEVSQRFHLNPLSGHWLKDTTYNQRHINSAIVYNIWLYFQTTNDIEFLSFYGIEMALEISRFWISSLKYNPQKRKYEIKNVVGPDEFHTHYPNSDENGIHNNFYTNYMASWCIWTSLKMLNVVSETRQNEILNSLGLKRIDILEWSKRGQEVFLPFDENGLMEQFEGSGKLKDLDWTLYQEKYGNIQRIDRILEKEGLHVNDYKVNKQADALMLYYLFSVDELKEGFERLSYDFKEADIQKNIDYHLSISTNGSSLSKVVHAWVLSRHDREKSWEWFKQSLEEDFNYSEDNTTSEGIHLGAMAGTIDLVQRCFTGIEVKDGILSINPRLPSSLQCLNLLIHFQGNSFEIIICDRILNVKVKASLKRNEQINILGNFLKFKKDDEFSFEIPS